MGGFTQLLNTDIKNVKADQGFHPYEYKGGILIQHQIVSSPLLREMRIFQGSFVFTGVNAIHLFKTFTKIGAWIKTHIVTNFGEGQITGFQQLLCLLQSDFPDVFRRGHSQQRFQFPVKIGSTGI